MSKPYQMNYPDMARFFDDLSHVLQTGGMRSIIYQTGGGFIDTVKRIVSFFVLCVGLYIAYKMIFGGYPRVIINLLTFSFYRKENMDNFLRENAMFLKTFQILQYRAPGYKDPFEAFDVFYGTNLGKQLHEKIMHLDATIKKYYSEYKYDDQFYEAFKEYYLYYNKATIGKSDITIIQTPDMDPKKDYRLPNINFYKTNLGYFINIGKLNPKNKSDDQKIIEVHEMDKKLGYKYFKRFVSTKEAVDAIAKDKDDKEGKEGVLSKMVNLLQTHPYTAYLIIPENDLDYQAFANDFQKFKDEIMNGTIYNRAYEELNDFSWYIIEYIQFEQNRQVFNKFQAEFHSLRHNSQEKNTIKKYLNVPISEKKLAESRVFNRVLVKREPKLIDPNRSSFNEKEHQYPPEQRTSTAFLEFVNKHPIFANVMFADDIKMNKIDFYNNVMNMYYRFCTNNGTSKDYLKNIAENAPDYKRLVNCAFIFNLYLSPHFYRDKIMNIYQDQNYDNKEFFERLWRPFYVDYIINRIGSEYKRTFNKRTWSRSYARFLIWWTKLGQLLKRIMKSIWRSFKRGTGVKPPKPEPT